METKFIIAELECAQRGDQQGVLDLIVRFNPLLRRYAYELGYEDAYLDLRCEIILVIKKKVPPSRNFPNDGAITNYIERTIINAYKRIVRKIDSNSVLMYFNEFSESELYWIEKKGATLDKLAEIRLDSFERILTAIELSVMYRHYIQDLSIAEISACDGISRQNVNKTKNRALKKLRNHINAIE